MRASEMVTKLAELWADAGRDLDVVLHVTVCYDSGRDCLVEVPIRQVQLIVPTVISPEFVSPESINLKTADRIAVACCVAV